MGRQDASNIKRQSVRAWHEACIAEIKVMNGDDEQVHASSLDRTGVIHIWCWTDQLK
jgi:hypothetical protein